VGRNVPRRTRATKRGLIGAMVALGGGRKEGIEQTLCRELRAVHKSLRAGSYRESGCSARDGRAKRKRPVKEVSPMRAHGFSRPGLGKQNDRSPVAILRTEEGADESDKKKGRKGGLVGEHTRRRLGLGKKERTETARTKNTEGETQEDL